MSQIFDVFLNTKDKRLIEIADFLFEYQSSNVLLKTIAKKLRLTTSIIREVLQEYIQMDLDKCGLKIEEITKERINYSSINYSSNLLKQLLIRKSHLFMLCEQLFHKKFENIVAFSVETYTSVSTIYRKLPLLKRLLKDYHLKLDLTESTFFIGNEKQIRHFYFDLFYLAYGLTDDYQRTKTKEILEIRKLPFPVLKKFELFGFITKLRIDQGYFLDEKIPTFVYYAGSINKEMVESYFQKIIINEMTDEEKEKEINFFVSYLVTLDILGPEEIRMETFFFESAQLDLIKSWIVKMTFFFNIELSTKMLLFLQLNLFYHFSREKFLVGSINQNIGKVWGVVTNNSLEKRIFQFLQSINEDFDDSLKNKDFYSLLIKEVLMNSRKKVNVCVVSGIAHAQKKYIENEISRFSLVPVDFSAFITDQTNLVVSDYYFKKEKKIEIKEIDTLFIKSYPSFEEYQMLSERILSIYSRL